MTQGQPGSDSKISPRIWIGALIAALVVWFIAANTDETNITFLWVDTFAPLWFALGLAGLGGFLVGWLMGRRRR